MGFGSGIGRDDNSGLALGTVIRSRLESFRIRNSISPICAASSSQCWYGVDGWFGGRDGSMMVQCGVSNGKSHVSGMGAALGRDCTLSSMSA